MGDALSRPVLGDKTHGDRRLRITPKEIGKRSADDARRFLVRREVIELGEALDARSRQNL